MIEMTFNPFLSDEEIRHSVSVGRIPYQQIMKELVDTWGEPDNGIDDFVGNDIYHINSMVTEGKQDYVTSVIFKTEESKMWAALKWT